jgi:hypothetical protein
MCNVLLSVIFILGSTFLHVLNAGIMLRLFWLICLELLHITNMTCKFMFAS